MSEDTFWTDKLVKEMLIDLFGNNERNDSVSDELILKFKQSKVKQPIPLFDEQKINARIDELVAMEKGFNIAREIHSNNPIGKIEYYDGDWGEHYPYKYKTFLDYQRNNK